MVLATQCVSTGRLASYEECIVSIELLIKHFEANYRDVRCTYGHRLVMFYAIQQRLPGEGLCFTSEGGRYGKATGRREMQE